MQCVHVHCYRKCVRHQRSTHCELTSVARHRDRCSCDPTQRGLARPMRWHLNACAQQKICCQRLIRHLGRSGCSRRLGTGGTGCAPNACALQRHRFLSRASMCLPIHANSTPLESPANSATTWIHRAGHILPFICHRSFASNLQGKLAEWLYRGPVVQSHYVFFCLGCQRCPKQRTCG